MKDSTEREIDRLVAELADRRNVDDFAEAREMLGPAGFDVLRALSIAALVGAARRVRRTADLEAERAATTRANALMFEQATPPTTPTGAGIRKDSAQYVEWVQNTPEGAKYHSEEAAAEERRWGEVRDLIERFEHNLKVKWTSELLATNFSLPDGTVTTWGAATVDQHRARYQMFARNVAANAEGAARHQQAVRDIEAADVGTLDELVERAA